MMQRDPHSPTRPPRPVGLPAALLVPAWIACLGLLMALVLNRVPVPFWGNPLGEAQSAEIGRDSRVGQAFIAPQPGLAGVAVTIHAQPSIAARSVTLRLARVGDAAPIAERSFDLGPEGSTSRLRLDLTPIADSQGAPFHISLESDSAAGQGLTAGYGPSSMLEGATADINGRRIDGDLQFLTYYSPSLRQKVGLLLAGLAGDKPGLLGTKGLYVAAALLTASLLGMATWQAVRPDQRGRPRES